MFRTSLSVRRLFDAPTLGELADAVTTALHGTGGADVEADAGSAR
jgi:hypothetical protein